MEEVYVTVIMPVYNAENTIRFALDSLVSQTMPNWECVIVDDGSKDSSWEICDEYSTNDSRFRVFHIENHGVSYARQKGLDNARGKYVIHVDPDDWVEKEMLHDMVSHAEKHKADMVIADYFYGPRINNTLYSCQKPSDLSHWIVLKELFFNIHGSCCNKLVRKSVIDRFNVKFPEGINFCEDMYFNACLLIKDITVDYLPKPYYHYVCGENSGSVCSAYNKEIAEHDIELYNKLELMLQDTIALKNFRILFSFMILYRAYKSSLFTNREFSDRYSKFLKDACQRCGFIQRITFRISCFGFHSQIRKIEMRLRKALA